MALVQLFLFEPESDIESQIQTKQSIWLTLRHNLEPSRMFHSGK